MPTDHGLRYHYPQRRKRIHSSPWCGLHALRQSLVERVAEPFSNACGAIAVVADVGLVLIDDAVVLPPNPGHPVCTEESCRDYCREAWQNNLAQFKTNPRTNIHRCKTGRLCAVVPVVFRGRCVAATKLVCPANVSEARFRNLVSILEVLVRDCVASEDAQWNQADLKSAILETNNERTERAPESKQSVSTHPIVHRALKYIEEHLCDSELSVRRVAESLGLNTNYLSHVFANEMGERMGLLITKRRIARAQTLLATTRLQIKCVAQDTGHANANWFSHVFRVITGITPNQYRARMQRSIA